MQRNKDYELIKQLILGKEKLEGVKFIRKVLDVSLKEAKELYEKFERDFSLLDSYFINEKEDEAKFIITEENSRKRIKQFILEGKKLEGIKEIREILSVSLKEAKELYEKFETDFTLLENYSLKKEKINISRNEKMPDLFHIAVEAIKIFDSKGKIEAVKYLREQLGIGISNAMEVLENYKKTGKLSLEKFKGTEPKEAPEDNEEPTSGSRE